jgi:hypothetical protein
VFLEILEGHPESTIVVILNQLDLFLGFIGPFGTIVTPFTIPLEITPWVSDLNNVCLFALVVIYRCNSNNTVSMTNDETFFLELLDVLA